MELVTFNLIADICASVSKVARSFLGGDRRRRLGEWMMEFGDLLTDVVARVTVGEYPHVACARMIQMVDQFEYKMDGVVDVLTVARIRRMLDSAKMLDNINTELGTLPPDERDAKVGILGDLASEMMNMGYTISRT